MNLWRLVPAMLIFAFAALPTFALAQKTDLDEWFNRELTPFVQEQLKSHPRFKGESIRFVAMLDGTPQATSNRLALDLRDRLQAAAADVPGVTIAWQANDPALTRTIASGGIDCTKGEAHYLIGIDVQTDPLGVLKVDVRALDLEDRAWVAGLSKSWQGRITAQQRRALNKTKTDQSLQGERTAPYRNAQSDLLAAHLAHDLACSLLQQTHGEYVVTAADAGTDSTNTMLELVSNNLGEFRALRFAADTSGANAVIEGKAHRIDNDLFQYWITVRPKEMSSDLPALSASAYVLLPGKLATTDAQRIQSDLILETDADYLSALRIVETNSPAACLRTPSARVYDRSRINPQRDCFALQVLSNDDAVVFFLNHQLNNGLVRLSDTACTQRASARIARTNERVHFLLPRDALPSTSWSMADTWHMTPEADTYYAVAASDTKAARALSKHIAELPKRCSASVRPGIEGTDLQTWMAEFSDIVNRWAPSIDWQMIHVRNRY